MLQPNLSLTLARWVERYRENIAEGLGPGEIVDNVEGDWALAYRKPWYRHKPTGTMLPFEGSPTPVPVTEKRFIVAHITGIAFGVSKGQLLAARQWGALEHEARRAAYHARFWKVPYHYVGLRSGDVLRNNRLTWWTYHGGAANRQGIGVALECHWPGLERARKAKHTPATPNLIETGRQTLRLAVQEARQQGAPAGELRAHRQYSSDRQGDPGELWWREIGRPVARELGLSINYRFKHGSGTMIARDWDESGLVDYRGRPLAHR